MIAARLSAPYPTSYAIDEPTTKGTRMIKTIEELKEFREELVELRLEKVFRLTAYQDDRLASVANIQTAIAAIDAVIEKGDLPPPFDSERLSHLSKL